MRRQPVEPIRSVDQIRLLEAGDLRLSDNTVLQVIQDLAAVVEGLEKEEYRMRGEVAGLRKSISRLIKENGELIDRIEVLERKSLMGAF